MARLKFYNCHVRHAGNMLHTIPRNDVSAKELVLLRSIHGDDALDRVSPAGEKRVDMDEHYLELARTYGRQKVEQVLGVSLANFDFWLQDRLEDEQAQRESRSLNVETARDAQDADPFDDVEDDDTSIDAEVDSDTATVASAVAATRRGAKDAAVA
jgi:hypothetical protein